MLLRLQHEVFNKKRGSIKESYVHMLIDGYQDYQNAIHLAK